MEGRAPLWREGCNAMRRSGINRFTVLLAAIGALAGGLVSSRMANYGVDAIEAATFELESVSHGAVFAKMTDLAPGDTLELAVHAKNTRRLAFEVRRIGSQERYEEIPLPNASTSEPCYDGDGGDAIADYPARTGCPSSHIRRGWFGCRSSDGAWLASANSDAECWWYTLRQPQPPTLPPPPPPPPPPLL